MSCSRLNGVLRGPSSRSTFPALHVATRPNGTSSPFSFPLAQRPSFSLFHTTTRGLDEPQGEQPNKEEQTKEASKEGKEGEGAKQDPKDVKIKELEAEVAELKSKLTYSYAERENIRRIAREDVAKEKEYGISSFAKNMLEVADNLSRCLQSVPKEDLAENKGLKTLFEGVELTERELLKTFKRNGIEKFEPANEKFDPNRMNALTQFPVEGKEPGTVAAVLKSGFFLKDRVLRPADVAVVKAPEEGS